MNEYDSCLDMNIESLNGCIFKFIPMSQETLSKTNSVEKGEDMMEGRAGRIKGMKMKGLGKKIRKERKKKKKKEKKLV